MTTATPSPAPNASGWNTTSVTVALNAVDNPGGSGVQRIQYWFDSTGVHLVSGSSACRSGLVVPHASGLVYRSTIKKRPIP